MQLGYTGGDADELVDRTKAEMYGGTERQVSEDYLPLADIMHGAVDETEAIRLARRRDDRRADRGRRAGH